MVPGHENAIFQQEIAVSLLGIGNSGVGNGKSEVGNGVSGVVNAKSVVGIADSEGGNAKSVVGNGDSEEGNGNSWWEYCFSARWLLLL